MELQDNPAPTLYEQLGGSSTINVAVDLFFLKAMEDDSISPFFRWTHMRQEWDKPKAYLVHILGGPSIYEEKDIAEINAHLRTYSLSEDQWKAILKYCEETLAELGIPPYLIDQVINIASEVKSELNLLS